jgi:hypothetical protein
MAGCGSKGMKKGGMAKKKAPKGMHYMPDGKLMKDSAHKKMKAGGMAKSSCGTKKMAKGGGVKIRGTGAATKGTMARGPMA